MLEPSIGFDELFTDRRDGGERSLQRWKPSVEPTSSSSGSREAASRPPPRSREPSRHPSTWFRSARSVTRSSPSTFGALVAGDGVYLRTSAGLTTGQITAIVEDARADAARLDRRLPPSRTRPPDRARHRRRARDRRDDDHSPALDTGGRRSACRPSCPCRRDREPAAPPWRSRRGGLPPPTRALPCRRCPLRLVRPGRRHGDPTHRREPARTRTLSARRGRRSPVRGSRSV